MANLLGSDVGNSLSDLWPNFSILEKMGFYESVYLHKRVEALRDHGVYLCTSISRLAARQESVFESGQKLVLVGDDSEERAKYWFRWMGFGANTWEYAAYFEDMVAAYVQLEYDGYKDVRCLLPWNAFAKNISSSATIADIIKKEDLSCFDALVKAKRVKISRSLLRNLIAENNSGFLVEHIILNHRKLLREFSVRELLFLVCAACVNEEKSVRVVRALLTVDPDACKVSDVNGFTPLVYTLYLHRSRNVPHEFHPFIKRRTALERLLIDNGCDPNSQDRFGLSFRTLADAGLEFLFQWSGNAIVECSNAKSICDDSKKVGKLNEISAQACECLKFFNGFLKFSNALSQSRNDRSHEVAEKSEWTRYYEYKDGLKFVGAVTDVFRAVLPLALRGDSVARLGIAKLYMFAVPEEGCKWLARAEANGNSIKSDLPDGLGDLVEELKRRFHVG